MEMGQRVFRRVVVKNHAHGLTSLARFSVTFNGHSGQSHALPRKKEQEGRKEDNDSYHINLK